jgi:glycosyltransferase involved in cell wall biosynthesis
LAHLDGVIGAYARASAISHTPPPNSRVIRAIFLVSPVGPRSVRTRRHFAHADVVHFPLTLMLPRTRRPTVVTLHDLLHHDRPEDFSRLQLAWRAQVYDRAARRADHVITVSEHARARIIDRLGISEDRVHAVYHGVDASRFQSTDRTRDEEIAQHLKLPGRFIFFPASLWPHKNHLALLEALAVSGLDDVSLVLSGATFGRLAGFEVSAARLGVADRVHHIGFIPDDWLPTVYRRATGLAFPSLYEGFGIPPLEAMASGCPVASTRCGALAEICGDAIIELQPQSIEQMAHAIRTLVTDEPLRSRLRERGRRRVEQFSWARSADGHEAVYRLAAKVG